MFNKFVLIFFSLFLILFTGCSFINDKPSDKQIVNDVSINNKLYKIIDMKIEGIVLDGKYAYVFYSHKREYKKDIYDFLGRGYGGKNNRIKYKKGEIVTYLWKEYPNKNNTLIYIKTDRGWKNIEQGAYQYYFKPGLLLKIEQVEELF